MSDKEDMREIVEETLPPAQPVRTPWSPVSEAQVERRKAEVAKMLREDAARLAEAEPTDLQQAERGPAPPPNPQP
ncbi:MAG TPA: hypothetical protein VFM49_16460 [Chloroflexia bacterium]|nr:hypothetical protein [Chloroflexia bacterium]